MALEDLSAYTEVDPNSRITPTVSRTTWAGLTSGEDAYTYSDKGANYFAGNFEIRFTLRLTATVASHVLVFVSLANLLDDVWGIDNANGSLLGVYLLGTVENNRNLYLLEIDSGAQWTSDIYALSLNTDYYLTFKRDESVGTYGTIYCYVYSDFARATSLATLSIALHTSKKDFRYIYSCHTYNTGATETTSGYIEALEIVSNVSSPVVSTQPCTAISGTTATGNGTISDLGSSSVTEHGHCWSTSINPTTANSKTTNGAGSLGSFTSSITGLSAGVGYYTRAYATNSAGTSYGANVYFRASMPQTQRPPREIGIKDDQVRFIGEDGIQYKLTGTAV